MDFIFQVQTNGFGEKLQSLETRLFGIRKSECGSRKRKKVRGWGGEKIGGLEGQSEWGKGQSAWGKGQRAWAWGQVLRAKREGKEIKRVRR
jgi:hypothetical protein